jgi:hypothetical protein
LLRQGTASVKPAESFTVRRWVTDIQQIAETQVVAAHHFFKLGAFKIVQRCRSQSGSQFMLTLLYTDQKT